MIKPYKFQEEDICKATGLKKLILASDMGTGKTLVATLTMFRSNVKPLLIICPASLKYNWAEEYEKLTGRTALVLNDSIARTFPIIYKSGLADAFIVNYESLSKYFVLEMPKNRKNIKLKDIVFNDLVDFFKGVIIDESHNVCNPDAIRSKLAARICQNKEYVILATGTPVLNTPIDLISPLAMIGQISKFGGGNGFKIMYSEPTEMELIELNEKLIKNCMIRREKKDVLELPAKTRQKILVDITNWDEYKLALNDLAQYLRDVKGKTEKEVAKSMRGEIMVRISMLKQISAKGKLKAVHEFIRDCVDKNEKVVIFGETKEVMAELIQKYNALHIIGGDSSEQRQDAVKRFQTDPNEKMICCSLKAGGVGTTLTAARLLLMVQMPWHSALSDQAEDRINRIGQTRENHSIYFIAKGTIDEYMWNLIEKKREVSGLITGTSNDISWQIIQELAQLI